MEVKITLKNFEIEVLKSDKPVLLDFWATWCGPCAMIAPILEEIAKENSNIKICKADIDENMELAQKFKITVVPTLMVFKNGEVVKQTVGVQTKEQILDLFN